MHINTYRQYPSMILGVALGAIAADYFRVIFMDWTVAASISLLILTFCLREFKSKIGIIFIVAFMYGFSFIAVHENHWRHVGWRAPGKIIVLEGEVASFPEQLGKQQRFDFQLQNFRMEETEWQKCRGKVQVFVQSNEVPPLIGDRIILKGKISFPEDVKIKGIKNKRHMLFVRGILAQIYVRKPGDMVWEGWNFVMLPLRILQMLRETASQNIEDHYPVYQSGILKALLLGLPLDDYALRLVFARTGTSHLLSVSGFHTSVVALIIFSAALLLRFRPQSAVTAAIVGTLAYAAITGYGVAVIRSAVMTVFVWLAWILGRPQKALYWLSVACALILFFDPKFIWDISFQLSFLSMFGILLIPRYLPRFLRYGGLDISIAAFLATYPVVLFHFQTWPWISIFANLAAVPVFALILPLGFFALLPFAGIIGVFPVKVLLAIDLWLLEKMAAFPEACPVLGKPDLAGVWIYYVAGGACLWFCHREDAH